MSVLGVFEERGELSGVRLGILPVFTDKPQHHQAPLDPSDLWVDIVAVTMVMVTVRERRVRVGHGTRYGTEGRIRFG